MYAMLIFSLLLVPACLGAPPAGPDTHVHAEDACSKSYCRVSNGTLDSALKTFLCMKEDDIKGLREKEKKLVLAQKIAPLLKMNADGSSVEDILAEMDKARLVPIVNLVLHDHEGDAAVEPKTELEYTRALREGLSSSTSLQPSTFRRTSPIVLGILNCQAKLLSKLHDLVLGAQRDGRGSGNGFQGFFLGEKIMEELAWFKEALNFNNFLNVQDSPKGLNMNNNQKLTSDTMDYNTDVPSGLFMGR